MKRIITSCIAVTLLASMLFSCSAYKNPTKYIDAPSKGEATISAAEIAKQFEEQKTSILEDNRESKYTEVTDADYAAQKGDQVTIIYTGTLVDKSVELTDKEIAGMTNAGEDDKPFDLVLGSDSFIGAYESEDHPEKNNEGFEDQLIGSKKGDKVTVTVTFPDDYQTKVFQGQVATFDVEIKTIARNIINNESAITVEYDFAEVKDDESESTESGESGEAVPQDGESESTEDKKEETSKAKFEDTFKSGKFAIDYTTDIEGTFNKIFKISEYATKFQGKYVYYEEDVKYTVPDDVDDDFKDFIGTEIKITFTITEVTNLPVWDDEFIAELTSDEYKTVADYNKFLEDGIKQSLAMDAIIAATTVTSYPKKEVKETYKTYVDTYVSEKLQGKSPSDYTNSQLKEYLTDEVYADIYARAASAAYSAVKERLVVEFLIDELNIEISNKEYKEKRAEYFEEYKIYFQYYYGILDEKSLEKYYGKEALKLEFLTEKLYEVIVDYVTISE